MTRLPLHWEILIGMLLGAAVGISCNVWLGTREAAVPPDAVPAPYVAITFLDSTDHVEILATGADGQRRSWHVDPRRVGVPDVFGSVEQLAEAEPEIARLFRQYGASWARRAGHLAQRLGHLFLRLLQMVAIPLIITSLVSGVIGLSSARRLRRMFSLTITYFLFTSMLAIVTGLVLVGLIRPGLRGGLQLGGGGHPAVATDLGGVLLNQLETMIPANPFAALAEGNFLSIIVLSIVFGVFVLLVGGGPAERMKTLFDDGFRVMMALTLAIIRLAPLGVLLLMLHVTATQGVGVFQSLAWYMLTVAMALGIHAFITLPLLVKYLGQRGPGKFAQAVSPALLTAFSSASSNGTLPLTLACVEQRAGISNRVSSFVLPLGATINMDGTALYEAVAVLFIAQLHFGVQLAWSTQCVVAITALLASVGAAGIPHAGLVMMVVILQTVGLPLEMQGLIIAVDRVLDMCRTSVNVWSDCCGCAVVARWEEGSGGTEQELSAVEGA